MTLDAQRHRQPNPHPHGSVMARADKSQPHCMRCQSVCFVTLKESYSAGTDDVIGQNALVEYPSAPPAWRVTKGSSQPRRWPKSRGQFQDCSLSAFIRMRSFNGNARWSPMNESSERSPKRGVADATLDLRRRRQTKLQPHKSLITRSRSLRRLRRPWHLTCFPVSAASEEHRNGSRSVDFIEMEKQP